MEEDRIGGERVIFNLVFFVEFEKKYVKLN